MEVAAMVDESGHAEPSYASEAVETDPSGRYTRYDHILGRGAFKTVFKAFDEMDGIEVAWNQVKVNDMVSSSSVERERLFAEIRVLKQLKHKNIMSFYDSWLDSKNLTVNFVTELFTSGTLRQFRKKRKVVDDTVLKRWAWQILQGLVYLHGHNPPIIHRDLKCDNIFVNGACGVIKLGDLGLATLWRGLTAPQSVLGTPEFMAPELYEEKYNEKVDVYSFGMCMLELATMEYPYAECKNAAQIYRKVTQGVLPGGLAKVEDPGLRQFIELCIRHDPEQRPEARQLLKNSFFESIRTGKMSCPGVDKAICERNNEDDCPEPPEGPSSSSDEANGASPPARREDGLPAGARAGTGTGNGQELPAVANGAGPTTPSQQANGTAAAGAVHQVAQGDEATAPAAGPTTDAASAAAAAAAAAAASAAAAAAAYGDGDEDEDAGSTDRDFVVSCHQIAESNKLGFQLKFTEPVGGCKTIEFAFDLHEDTADAIANEMMEDLSLSALEAQTIASKIRQAVSRSASPAAAVGLGVGAAALGVRLQLQVGSGHSGSDAQPTVPPPTPQPSQLGHPGSGIPTPGAQPVQRPQPASWRNGEQQRQQQMPAAVAASEVPSKVQCSVSQQTQEQLPQVSEASRRTSSTGVLKSEPQTPTESTYNNRPPSIHALIAAMKEVHEQEHMERSATAPQLQCRKAE